MVEEASGDNADGDSGGGIRNNGDVDGDVGFGDHGGGEDNSMTLASRDLTVQCRQEASGNCLYTL